MASTQSSAYATSRWCPTMEQLRALEELYRRGIRTPSTFQIQQITAHLRRFGKIEGKNVFYWFQNHKARERQKIRRRLSTMSTAPTDQNEHHCYSMQHHPRVQGKAPKPKGMQRRADFHLQQTKSWASALAPLQDAVPSLRADIEKDGWIQHFMMNRQPKQQHYQRMCLVDMGTSPSRHSRAMPSTTSTKDHCCWPPASANSVEVRPKTLDLFPLGCDDKAEGDPVRFFEFL